MKFKDDLNKPRKDDVPKFQNNLEFLKRFIPGAKFNKTKYGGQFEANGRKINVAIDFKAKNNNLYDSTRIRKDKTGYVIKTHRMHTNNPMFYLDSITKGLYGSSVKTDIDNIVKVSKK